MPFLRLRTSKGLSWKIASCHAPCSGTRDAKFGVSGNWERGFLISVAKNYSAGFNERDWSWSHLLIWVFLVMVRCSLTNNLVPMFQHGRRLMVDQCTTCDCFQSAPRKYTLRCTKLNCQACPVVSVSSLGVLPRTVSHENRVLHCMHPFTLGTSLGPLAFPGSSVFFPWIRW